jgi:hypothetical protein
VLSRKFAKVSSTPALLISLAEAWLSGLRADEQLSTHPLQVGRSPPSLLDFLTFPNPLSLVG